MSATMIETYAGTSAKPRAETSTENRATRRLWGRLALLGGLILLCVVWAPFASADMVLSDQVNMVIGNQTEDLSFTVPGAGTVTADLTPMDWPTSLGALSFSATTTGSVLASWAGTSGSGDPSFAVSPGVNYFTHLSAAATGPLDIGLYSYQLTFTPAGAPVPLPAAGWLLLIGVLMVISLVHVLRRSSALGLATARLGIGAAHSERSMA